MRSRIDPRRFVERMRPALHEAASLTRAMQERVVNRPKSGETSDVKAALTEADTASQEVLLAALLEHFPRVRLAAEEDTPSVARFPDSGEGLVVIDPIDGTLRFYLEQEGPYAIMVGLAVDDRYVAALIALPRENRFFCAVQGSGAQAGIGDALEAVRIGAPGGRQVVVSHNLAEPIARRLEERGYEVCAGSGGAIAIAPLLPGVCGGIRISESSPRGVSIRGRIGALIAREAGARVSGRERAFPETLGAPETTLVVSANADVERDLLEAVHAV